MNMRYQLHFQCYRIEKLWYSLGSLHLNMNLFVWYLFLITSKKGKTLLHIVQCEGIPCDFIEGFRPVFKQSGNEEVFVKSNLPCSSARKSTRKVTWIVWSFGFWQNLKNSRPSSLFGAMNYGKVILARLLDRSLLGNSRSNYHFIFRFISKWITHSSFLQHRIWCFFHIEFGIVGKRIISCRTIYNFGCFARSMVSKTTFTWGSSDRAEFQIGLNFVVSANVLSLR